jgi:hypothetical protein
MGAGRHDCSLTPSSNPLVLPPIPTPQNISGSLDIDDNPLVSWDDDPYIEWVQLSITGNGKSHSVWYERDGVGNKFTCADGFCEIAPAIVWPGGNYTVKMRAWGSRGTSAWATSAEPLVLPGMPQNVSGDPRDGRPHITWNEDPYIEWVQVYIGGNGQLYQQWHERDGDKPARRFTCNGGTCQLAPVIDWPGGNYQVWMQAWGSRGLSQWTESNNPLQLPTDPPLAPIPVPIGNGDDLQVTWTHSQYATWYQIWILSGSSTMHNKWYLADDVCLPDCSVIPVPLLPSDVGYTIWMRAWGPGGMSTGGTGTPNGQWNKAVYTPS